MFVDACASSSRVTCLDLREAGGLPVASIPSIPFELVEISTTTL